MSFQDFKAKARAAKNGNNNSNSDSDSSSDYEKYPLVSMKPDTFLSFDRIEKTYMFGYTTDKEGNPIENPDSGQGKGNLLVTVTNPSVASGQLLSANGREDGTVARDSDGDVDEYFDYILADPDDDGFEPLFDENGDPKGIKPNKRTDKFGGHPVDDFTEDTVEIQLTGRAARDVARVLDVNGSPSAKYDANGEPTKGLIEWHPDARDLDRGDLKSRRAGSPELRDLEWEENGGGFISMMYESAEVTKYTSYEATIAYNDFGDNVGDATILEPQYNPEAVEYDRPMFWHEPPVDASASEGDKIDFRSDPSESASEGDASDMFSLDSIQDKHERDFIKDFVNQADLHAGQEPIDIVKGGWDGWERGVRKNYQGTHTVDDAFIQKLNDACAEYAESLGDEQ